MAKDKAGKVALAKVRDFDLASIDSRIDTLEGATHTHSNKAILDATTESFTTALKNTINSASPSTHDHNTVYYTKSEVDTKVASIVESAPETLNTLNELAAALGDDPNFAITIAAQIGAKENAITAGTASQYFRGDKTWATMPTSLPASDVYAWAKASVKPSYVWSEIGSKPTTFPPDSHTHSYAGSSSAGGSATSVANSCVLKFNTGTTEGTNLYTFNGSSAKTIDIKAGANVSLTAAAGVITISSTDTNTVYTHPASHPPSIITQDASNRFVTDTEKATWNGKASTSVATTSVNGLMSSTDKTKLDGVATGANNYVHPTGDGNLHVPANGTTNNGKFLMAGATAGSLSWGVPADTNTTYTFSTGTTNGTFNVTPSGGSLTPISIYGLGTAAYTASTAYATSAHTHTSLSDNVHYLTQDFCQQANTLVSGGGTIAVDATGYVKWSERFIIIASGRHADYSAESGYFDITCPTTGTITGVGGATNKTATASGIPLAAFEALYYILPIGATYASVPANFRVVSYTANVDIPATWIKIAKRHDDTPTYVDFANGVSLKLGESLNSETYDVMNAYKAAILETTRTINTVNFNGSANIVVEPYVEQDLTTNATRYICFVDSSTAGYQRHNLDTSLTFNPSTDTLGIVNISASGTLTETSDRRLKTNIQPIRNAIDKVQQLQGCTFNKQGFEARLTGVIAQDVQMVLPEAIVTDDNGYLSVAYGNLVGLLIESIKELTARVEELEKR